MSGAHDDGRCFAANAKAQDGSFRLLFWGLKGCTATAMAMAKGKDTVVIVKGGSVGRFITDPLSEGSLSSNESTPKKTQTRVSRRGRQCEPSQRLTQRQTYNSNVSGSPFLVWPTPLWAGYAALTHADSVPSGCLIGGGRSLKRLGVFAQGSWTMEEWVSRSEDGSKTTPVLNPPLS